MNHVDYICQQGVARTLISLYIQHLVRLSTDSLFRSQRHFTRLRASKVYNCVADISQSHRPDIRQRLAEEIRRSLRNSWHQDLGDLATLGGVERTFPSVVRHPETPSRRLSGPTLQCVVLPSKYLGSLGRVFSNTLAEQSCR